MNVLDLIFDSTLSKRREAFVDIFMRIPNVNPSPHFQAKPGMLPELVPMIKDHYILEESSTRVSLQQLANIFDKTSNLKDFQIVEILMDLSEYKYGHMISKSMHLLNRYFSAHHSLFGSALHTRVLINKDSVKLHRFLEGKLPELHRLSTSKLGEMEITQLTSILDELIKNSHLKGDKAEPHGMNQNIMFSHGKIVINTYM
ncbi:uncharacterized protein LOC127835699 [Dreissena polymorpha]|uniref:uncharacterized protein LOC127835699 n=1 Tax=Dreissena polymorpha TaxID=45954 RepID=UPI00226448C8|nr:uncharacterized protein LOC127835699 [Dreissena polymorpha]